MLKQVNDSSKGFRGIVTILGTWVMLFADTFFLNISGFSPEALKIAFLATLPVTVKLIWTDLRPRLLELMK